MAQQPLSVVVITLNEEANIARCLRSVAWADERIVVDCGSSDRTVESAAEHGARVITREWSGYADQKNFAVDSSANEWVLSLDADEWLDEAAGGAIRRVLEAPRANGYKILRRTAFCGGTVNRTWGGDRQLRLFRKTAGRFSGGPVHEAFRLDAGSKAGRLGGSIQHLGYPSIHGYVERMNRYTDLAAEGLAGRQVSFRPLKLWFGPLVTFVKLYFLKLGFLDGVRGWIVAVGSSYYVLVREAKLWERRRQR
jgi:glycosyltransferase involved in cell wall biosynthesis